MRVPSKFLSLVSKALHLHLQTHLLSLSPFLKPRGSSYCFQNTWSLFPTQALWIFFPLCLEHLLKVTFSEIPKVKQQRTAYPDPNSLPLTLLFTSKASYYLICRRYLLFHLFVNCFPHQMLCEAGASFCLLTAVLPAPCIVWGMQQLLSKHGWMKWKEHLLKKAFYISGKAVK